MGKLSKEELRMCLYLYFSRFGQILDIVAMKTMKIRGQAFIVFKDIRSATKAIDGANRANLFGKQMDVSYAKTKSKALLEHQGKLAQAASIRKKNNSFGSSSSQKHRRNKGGDHKADAHSRLRI